MRITVILPSRGNPQGLLSVLTALDALATGQHEIAYVLLIDADDEDTRMHTQQWQHMGMMPNNTHTVIAERDRTLYARVNEAVGAFAADTFIALADDVYPLTHHWDSIFDGLRDQLPAYAWREANDPGNATYINVSDRWRDSVGRIFPEHFPFWFVDTWLLEVHLIAFAKGIGIINQLQLGGKRGKTRGMRDLAFWFRMFTATRSERIAEAEKLALGFGFTLNVERDRQTQLEQLRAIDAEQLTRVSEYEENRGGEVDAADENYTRIKAAAQVWLDANERRVLIPVGRQIEVVH